jgi:hypothetical protein
MKQAVIIHIPLHENPGGSASERESIEFLEDRLKETIESSQVGEFDGVEYGQGRCVMFTYGPDADQLYGLMEPMLRFARIARGGFAIKRYGEARDPASVEVRVSW